MSDPRPITIEAGLSISTAAREAVEKAVLWGRAVTFEFNGVPMIARPGDSTATIVDLWAARREAIVRGWRP